MTLTPAIFRSHGQHKIRCQTCAPDRAPSASQSPRFEPYSDVKQARGRSRRPSERYQRPHLGDR